MSIASNLETIRKEIQQLSQGREVTLLAVSKTKPVSAIENAIAAGQRAFGENYVQEGVEKIHYFSEKYSGLPLQWHFIGPLQSNKTRLVAENFHWCQTVDRLKIAQRLNDQRSPHAQPLNVLIQVNISDEESKSGIAPTEIMPLAQAIMAMPQLALRGLMAIPAPAKTQAAQEIPLAQMQKLFIELQQAFPQAAIDTLSMGMSDDMATAIACGSTMVRIGTAIFGTR